MKSAKQSILRLLQYKDFLNRAKNIGIKKVFSDDLAEAMATSSTQVRKDFSLFGISGNKKAGYNIDELIAQLNKLLGKDETLKVVIVGAGNIGKALMNYEGFSKEGIRIIAIFDTISERCNEHANPPILPIEKFREIVEKNYVEIGVIAVPYHSAQHILDLMISSGIKGVLNFAPISLKAPKDFYINDINLRVELESIGYFVRAEKKNRNKKESDKEIGNYAS